MVALKFLIVVVFTRIIFHLLWDAGDVSSCRDDTPDCKSETGLFLNPTGIAIFEGLLR